MPSHDDPMTALSREVTRTLATTCTFQVSPPVSKTVTLKKSSPSSDRSVLDTRRHELVRHLLIARYLPQIQKCQVMRDPHTKDSRGFAFVTMETAEEAEAAIAGLNATELMGRTVNVEKARRGRARTPTPGQYHGPPKRGPFMNQFPLTTPNP